MLIISERLAFILLLRKAGSRSTFSTFRCLRENIRSEKEPVVHIQSFHWIALVRVRQEALEEENLFDTCFPSVVGTRAETENREDQEGEYRSRSHEGKVSART